MERTRVFSFRDTGWLKWLGWLDSGPKRRTGPAHGSGTGPSGYLNSGQRGSAARLVQKVRSRSSSELATGKADPRPLFSGQRVVLGAAGRHAPVDWQLNARSGQSQIPRWLDLLLYKWTLAAGQRAPARSHRCQSRQCLRVPPWSSAHVLSSSMSGITRGTKAGDTFSPDRRVRCNPSE